MNRTVSLALVVSLFAVPAFVAAEPGAYDAQPQAPAPNNPRTRAQARAVLQHNLEVAERSVLDFETFAKRKPAKNASAKRRKDHGRVTSFFKQTAGKLRAINGRAHSALAREHQQTDTVLAEYESLNSLYRLQMQDVQSAVSDFSKSASIAASVSRAMHDIAMKFIANIRA